MINKVVETHDVKEINRIYFAYYTEKNDSIPNEILQDIVNNEESEYRVQYNNVSGNVTTEGNKEILNFTLQDEEIPRALWSSILFCDEKRVLSYIHYTISSGEIALSEIQKLNFIYTLSFGESALIQLNIGIKFWNHLENTLIDNSIHDYIERYNPTSSFKKNNYVTDQTYRFNIGGSQGGVLVHYYGTLNNNFSYVYRFGLNPLIKEIDPSTIICLCGSNTYGMYLITKNANNLTIYSLANNNISYVAPLPTTKNIILVEGVILVSYDDHHIYLSLFNEDKKTFGDWEEFYTNTEHTIYIPSFFDLCPVFMLDDGTFVPLLHVDEEYDEELYKDYIKTDTANIDIYYTCGIPPKIDNQKDLDVMMSYFSPSRDVSRYYNNLQAMRETYKTLKRLPEYRHGEHQFTFYDCGVVVKGNIAGNNVFIPYSLAIKYTKYPVIQDNDQIMNFTVIRNGKIYSLLYNKELPTIEGTIITGKYGLLLREEDING